MNAIVRDTYGSSEVVRLEDIPAPTPGEGEVLVRVHGSSVNRGDRYALAGKPYLMRLMTGLFGPSRRGIGQDLAGTVEAGRDDPKPVTSP